MEHMVVTRGRRLAAAIPAKDQGEDGRRGVVLADGRAVQQQAAAGLLKGGRYVPTG